jgi:hypothetical protein
MQNTTILAEDLANISSYQMLQDDKNWKVIKHSRSSIYKLAHICAPPVVKLLSHFCVQQLHPKIGNMVTRTHVTS